MHQSISIERALEFDPFQGDFGEQGDREISDKIVTAKKDHAECSCCRAPIKAGTKNRVKVEIYEREMMTHRWCQDCTAAMALVDARLSGEDPDWDEDGDEAAEHPYEHRVSLRDAHTPAPS